MFLKVSSVRKKIENQVREVTGLPIVEIEMRIVINPARNQ